MTEEKTRGQSMGVTDHCLVRYFERRFGIDIEQIKNEILPDYIRREITDNPDKFNYILNDLEFRIADDAVVTCVPLKNQEPLRGAAARKKHKKHTSNKKQPWQAQNKHSKRYKKGQLK